MKFGVVVFPGSNCDDDLVHILEDVMEQEVIKLWHKDESLHGLTTEDCILLPGGFSYGDYLRAGAIARFSPIMKSVIKFAQDGGIVWGICNGFQILCEAGLLPGTLLDNDNQKFICKNTYLRVETTDSPVSRQLVKGQVIKIPIAHAEGRYYAPEGVLQELVAHDQILFKYAQLDGTTPPSANPNGSVLHIAGICNKQRNVMGMMPHPERASENILANCDGAILFRSLVEAHASV